MAVTRSTGRLLAALMMLALGSGPAPAVSGPGLPDTAMREAYRRPDAIPFPDDNPFSTPKSDLGAMLFFDPRVSGPGTMSCASCHNPALGWKDGLPRGVGHDAKSLARATPTILNLAWGELLMWDGRKDGLEDQALGPVTSPAEMGQTVPELLSRLGDIPGYRRAFRAAFGADGITSERVAQAIATFERTLVSNKAPFDRWIDGDEAAIDAAAKRGFTLFNGRAGCAACHSGWRFTDDGFHDIGLASKDPGRGAQVPGEPLLQHAFKTPTLRNIAVRAPYMHDGSVPTLQEVVVHYDSGFAARPSLSPEMHRLGLTNSEVNELVAFMRTLTSSDDPIAAPVLPTKEQQ